MKLTHLFTINLILAIFFGLICAILPAWTLQLYGLAADAASVWTTRLVGGLILGFATLMWFGRRTPNVEARRAIALALLVETAIGLVASIEVQLSGQANAFGWSNPILYGLLALGYAYFFFLRPDLC
jgi:hypothetical protein